MAKQNPGFSKRLLGTLSASGLSQKALAQRLGIREQSMTKYCRRGGVPEWHILVPMAQLLNVSVDWLLTGQEPEVREVVRQECPVARAHDPLDRRPPDAGVVVPLGMAWSVLESQASTAKALSMTIEQYFEKLFRPARPEGEE